MKLSKFMPFILLALCLWLAFGGGFPAWPGIGGGATLFIVVREATKDDVRFGALKQELQDSNSTAAKEIAAAGWKSLVLDDDAMDKDDNPLPLFVKLGVYGSIADSRRELLAIAPPDKLVGKDVIPADATVDSVLAMMRARGKK